MRETKIEIELAEKMLSVQKWELVESTNWKLLDRASNPNHGRWAVISNEKPPRLTLTDNSYAFETYEQVWDK